MGYEDIPTCDYGTQQIFENSKNQEPVPETVKSSTERKNYIRAEHIKIFLIDGYVATYTDASIKITSKYIKIIDSSQMEIKISLNIVRDISLTNIVPIK